MKHVMVDLETLGIGRDAAIIQIGACVLFEPADLRREFIRNITFTPEAGNVEIGTLAWWMKQDKDVRAGVFDQTQAVDLRRALQDFTVWLNGIGEFRIWSNAATFDLRLIREACDRLGMVCPYNFRQEMCDRTARELGRMAKLPEPANTAMAHNALVDARNQARRLEVLLTRLQSLQ